MAWIELFDSSLWLLTGVCLHCFTRSEYCRNVKLKYCLEAEGAWAEGFRAKLGKAANEGGFTGSLTLVQSSDMSTAFCSPSAVFIGYYFSVYEQLFQLSSLITSIYL